MGQLGGLLGAGAPLFAGSQQGQLQGQQEVTGLQEAARDRAIRQQHEDIAQQIADNERMRIYSEAVGPARQEAYKVALTRDDNLGSALGHWKTAVENGKMTQEDYDKNVQNYKDQTDQYKTFGQGGDIQSFFSQFGSIPRGQYPNHSAAFPASTPTVANTPADYSNASRLNAGLAAGGTPAATPPATPVVQPGVTPESPTQPFTDLHLDERGSLPGGFVPGNTLSKQISQAVSPGLNVSSLIKQPELAGGPTTLLPISDITANLAKTPTKPAGKATQVIVPPAGSTPLVTLPGNVTVSRNADGSLVITDPNKTTTLPSIEGIQGKVDALVKPYEDRVKLDQQIVDNSFNTGGVPSAADIQELKDSKDRLDTAREKAYTQVLSQLGVGRDNLEAVGRTMASLGAGYSSFETGKETATLLEGKQHGQHIANQIAENQLLIDQSRKQYQDAQTEQERQEARKSMYGAYIAALELKDYPKEERKKLAKLDTDITTANIANQRSNAVYQTSKLKQLDPDLVENAAGLYPKESSRDLMGGGIGVGGVNVMGRTGSSQAGPGVDADKAWAVIKGSEKWLNNPDPSIRQMAKNIREEGITALRTSTAMVIAGNGEQVLGNKIAPSPASWLGRDLWAQYGGKQGFIKARGGNSNIPSVKVGLRYMDLWNNYYNSVSGKGTDRDPDAFARESYPGPVGIPGKQPYANVQSGVGSGR